MSTEQHKAIVRRFREEIWNQGTVEAVDMICAADYLHHFMTDGLLARADGLKRIVTAVQHPTPTLRFVIDDLIAEGNKVVERWTAYKVADNTRVVAGIDIYRVAGGRIAEKWGNWDHLGLLTGEARTTR